MTLNFADGRAAAAADIDIEELCVEPSEEWLVGYYAERLENPELGVVLTAVHRGCNDLRIRREVVELASRIIPADVGHALYRALVMGGAADAFCRCGPM